jgi:hypothetical protein
MASGRYDQKETNNAMIIINLVPLQANHRFAFFILVKILTIKKIGSTDSLILSVTWIQSTRGYLLSPKEYHRR